MQVITGIPFELDPAQLLHQAHIEPGTDDATDLLALVALAKEAGKPKAAWTEAYIEERDRDSIVIGGVRFTSRMLVRNLKQAERVFPHVATCGVEIDAVFPEKGDMLKEYWWELIKTCMLRAAGKRVTEHVRQRFRLGKTVSMHPGSGDASVWPIEQQKGLFSLLGDVETAIGVRLTDSFLMVPNKTTSGILFPAELDFRSCEVCRRENCPSRQAALNEQLWSEIEHE